MEQNKKNQNFSQPTKKNEMPERGENKKEIWSGAKTSTRPEIDLPLKSGKQDSNNASKNTQKKEDMKRNDRHDHEKTSR